MDYMPTAMKGVVLTSTGEILTTPTPPNLSIRSSVLPRLGSISPRSLTLRTAIAERRGVKNDTKMALLVRLLARARGKRESKGRIRIRTRMSIVGEFDFFVWYECGQHNNAANCRRGTSTDEDSSSYRASRSQLVTLAIST